MSFPFEFTVDGVALSQGAEGRGRWSNHVRNSAAQKWQQQPSVAEKVMVTITCFYHNREFDLDNILKPDSGCDEWVGLRRRRADH